MTFNQSDAFLCISLGLFGIWAVFIAQKQLIAVREAARVNQKEKEHELISQHTEDALKLETLRELAFGSNQDIRAAAVKIVTERSTQGPTYQLLLDNIAGENIDKRDQALTALRFLSITPSREKLLNYPTFKSLIDCLCNFIADEKAFEDQHDTDYMDRSQAERDALFILNQIIDSDFRDALRAGLVNRWLANYPFGGFRSTETQKRDVIQKLKTGQLEDNAMGHIIEAVHMQAEGRRQLRKHGLIGSVMEEPVGRVAWDGMREDGINFDFRQPPHRVHEESPEEHDLRRRRREAMVLNEGEPLTNDNIYQTGTSRDERMIF